MVVQYSIFWTRIGNMAVTYVSASVIIFLLLIAENIRSQSNISDSFTEDVKQALPHKDFLKLFTINHNNIDEVEEGLTKSINAFSVSIEAPVPEDIQQQFLQRVKKISNLTPDQLFRANAKALSGTLEDQGVLNSSNEKDVANSYADILKKGAHSLENESVPKTFPAIAKATSAILKSMGLSGSELVVRNFATILLHEIEIA